jgi:hypothetical protein
LKPSLVHYLLNFNSTYQRKLKIQPYMFENKLQV